MNLKLLEKQGVILLDFLHKFGINLHLKFYLNLSFWFFLIKQNVCICWKFQLVVPLIIGLFTTKSFPRKIFDVEFGDSLIIKFVPLILYFDYGIIVSGLGCAWMNGYSFELVIAIFMS